MSVVEIPRIQEFEDAGPAWLSVVDQAGKHLKPLIKCNCGEVVGIGLHHVHADGTVTASFYHAEAPEFQHNGKTYSHPPGCGWHVHLKLKDYALGDFPPSA